jgi:hypothetical protein
MGSESLLKKNKVIGIYSTKNIRGKRIQWQPEHDKEGGGCAQVFAGHHNKHPSSPIPKCCSRLVGTSTLHLLLSQVPILSGWVLPYPSCLNFATVYDFDLRDEDLKNTYFTRLNLFLSF